MQARKSVLGVFPSRCSDGCLYNVTILLIQFITVTFKTSNKAFLCKLKDLYKFSKCFSSKIVARTMQQKSRMSCGSMSAEFLFKCSCLFIIHTNIEYNIVTSHSTGI